MVLVRMGFHITEATCYLTADLFYLEVLLLPCGGVQEVKVAPHGEAPVVSRLYFSHQAIRDITWLCLLIEMTYLTDQ